MTFEMFKLKNQRLTWWNETDYIIPEFDPNEFLHVPCPTNPWLDNVLHLCSQVFRRRNEGDARTYINLIIMDILRDTQGFQTSGEMTHLSHPPLSALVLLPLPPQSPAYPRSMKSAYPPPSTSTARPLRSSAASTSALEHVSRCFGDEGHWASFESGFTQLLVYLAILHCARARKAPLVPDLKVNSTVYGVLSDGLRYVFVCLDNNSMFDIRSEKEMVMGYFRHCLRVVVASRPTSSPLTARVNREEDGQVEQYDYTGFEGFQDRIFTFQGVDAEQCDLVKWPSEDVVFRN